MSEMIEMGTVSSRGQICIPTGIREEMGLEEGSKVLFVMKDDAVLMKKVSAASWGDLTKPFREAKKKIKEEDVDSLIHKVRKEKNAKGDARH